MDVDTSREAVERVARHVRLLDDDRAADAAALLRALLAERDEAEKRSTERFVWGARAMQERDAARAEVERLREALRPLAAFAAHHPTTRQYGNRASSGEVWRMSSQGLPDAVLTVEDMHAAAALLEPAP